ncbi:hypothetical protein C900_05700 [Fulvivirga imtechensis AK7]|uniref:DUF3999 family protein n=1 Tax=Fulvivirga imtechensis AK7 TaxID=1237149 RepID=L8JMY5_9BACT|nr:DUF3999 family protein [Fulvivirga imtechensis]ELR68874.1 hypothetical protein C900_05700 [Fulvivirga imtechensis AK7]
MKDKFLVFVFIFSSHLAIGQMQEYSYKRPVEGVTDVWHSLVLPPAMFDNLNPELSDLRIYGITAQNDTIEAPYILRLHEDELSRQQVDFNLINTTRNARGHYFTFEVPSENTVNQLKLNFKEQNFDWRVTLEGSHDQKEWFTVVDKARMVSIKNNETDYAFTQLRFPQVKYLYLRVLVHNSKPQPTLLSATVTEEQLKKGYYNTYSVEKMEVENKHKQTIAQIELAAPVPVSQLNIAVDDTIDFYRPVAIQYLRDSTEVPNGWRHNYETIANGVLTSMEPNEFRFQNVVAKRLRVIVDNYDNQPLSVSSFDVQGPVFDLVARFTEPADYWLVYGNEYARKPQYDIVNFADKIPESATALSLGNEELIAKDKEATTRPLFENKWWLWTIMGIVILVLGYFSVQMLKTK